MSFIWTIFTRKILDKQVPVHPIEGRYDDIEYDLARVMENDDVLMYIALARYIICIRPTSNVFFSRDF